MCDTLKDREVPGDIFQATCPSFPLGHKTRPDRPRLLLSRWLTQSPSASLSYFSSRPSLPGFTPLCVQVLPFSFCSLSPPFVPGLCLLVWGQGDPRPSSPRLLLLGQDWAGSRN